MRALATQVWAAIRRRRAQTAIVLLLALLASAVAAMALTLLVRSTQPWDDAFARNEGPHLIFQLDASRVTPDQLRATGSLPDVTAASEPEPSALVPFEWGGQKGSLELIGRDSPDGALDRLTVVAGRWPQRPGEIAVTRTGPEVPLRPHVGDTIRALTASGGPSFTVAGEVLDFGWHGTENGTAAWVLPADVASLIGDDVRLGYVMAYRFAHAATAAELAADQQEIEAALPTGSEASRPLGWLASRRDSAYLINFLSGIILAFTFFALAAVAGIVAAVVAGAVVSSYREVGVLKALGFLPREVVAIFVAQMALPGLTGAILGIPLGALASQPLLADAATYVGLPTPSIVEPLVDLLVPLGLLVLVVLAAILPALPAARTNTVRAISLGSARETARRSRIASLLSSLRLPRPLTIGAGDAFARPLRSVLTLSALAIGIASATFAVGFQTIVGGLVNDRAALGDAQDVTVVRYAGFSDAALSARLSGQPETQTVVATRVVSLRLPGTDPVPLTAMRGDAVALGYQAAEGRWFSGPGEAVLDSITARKAGLKIGASFAGSVVGGGSITLRMVGIINDFNNRAMAVGWETFAAAEPGTAPDTYLVKLRPGADPQAFAGRIEALAPDSLDAHAVSIAEINSWTALIYGLIGGMVLVLLLIAAAAVFNATLLTTRERSRDIAILKAVGMTSRQVAAMAAGSTLVLALVAAAIGLPLGLWLVGAIWTSALASLGVVGIAGGGPAIGPLALALLGVLVIALLGTALPARWAAKTPVAAVLRSE